MGLRGELFRGRTRSFAVERGWCRGLSRHTDRKVEQREEGRGIVRYSGGGSSVGETVDPGSRSRAACPTIRSLCWGVAVICLFFFLCTQAELDIARSGGRFPLFISLCLSLFSSFSSFPLPACTSVGSCLIGGKKWARYLCQDNTGEHVHPCEREPKSAGSYTHPYPLLGSSCCRQVTGWCCSNVFRSERSRSICAEMRGMCARLHGKEI